MKTKLKENTHDFWLGPANGSTAYWVSFSFSCNVLFGISLFKKKKTIWTLEQRFVRTVLLFFVVFNIYLSMFFFFNNSCKMKNCQCHKIQIRIQINSQNPVSLAENGNTIETDTDRDLFHEWKHPTNFICHKRMWPSSQWIGFVQTFFTAVICLHVFWIAVQEKVH